VTSSIIAAINAANRGLRFIPSLLQRSFSDPWTIRASQPGSPQKQKATRHRALHAQ
jgi:hypothetical protein